MAKKKKKRKQRIPGTLGVCPRCKETKRIFKLISKHLNDKGNPKFIIEGCANCLDILSNLLGGSDA